MCCLQTGRKSCWQAGSKCQIPCRTCRSCTCLWCPWLFFSGESLLLARKVLYLAAIKIRFFFLTAKVGKNPDLCPYLSKKIFRTLLISGAPNGLISSLASIKVWEFYSTTMATNMYSDLTHAASWAWISAYLPPPIYPFPTTLAHHRPGKKPASDPLLIFSRNMVFTWGAN